MVVLCRLFCWLYNKCVGCFVDCVTDVYGLFCWLYDRYVSVVLLIAWQLCWLFCWLYDSCICWLFCWLYDRCVSVVLLIAWQLYMLTVINCQSFCDLYLSDKTYSVWQWISRRSNSNTLHYADNVFNLKAKHSKVCKSWIIFITLIALICKSELLIVCCNVPKISTYYLCVQVVWMNVQFSMWTQSTVCDDVSTRSATTSKTICLDWRRHQY